MKLKGRRTSKNIDDVSKGKPEILVETVDGDKTRGRAAYAQSPSKYEEIDVNKMPSKGMQKIGKKVGMDDMPEARKKDSRERFLKSTIPADKPEAPKNKADAIAPQWNKPMKVTGAVYPEEFTPKKSK